MGDALLIRNGSLAMQGRSLVTTAGGAPCCCGGMPPTCIPGGNNIPCAPPCIRRDDRRSLVRYTEGQAATIYDVPAVCCSAPPGCGGIYHGEEHRALYVQTGVLCEDWSIQIVDLAWTAGQTVANGSRRVIQRDNSCAPFSDTTQPLQLAAGNGCAPFGVLTPPTFRVNGFIRKDCWNLETDLESTRQGAGASGTGWVRVHTTCQIRPGTGCPPSVQQGACCCAGECFGGLSQAECAAMGGTWRGAGTNCIDINCTGGTSSPLLGPKEFVSMGCSDCGHGTGL